MLEGNWIKSSGHFRICGSIEWTLRSPDLKNRNECNNICQEAVTNNLLMAAFDTAKYRKDFYLNRCRMYSILYTICNPKGFLVGIIMKEKLCEKSIL